jgi:prepilin-type N-terminal cleavage/methylation domain-containing protein
MQNKKGLALSLSKGFTIIELIVVIAIIAVLAAIVLVNVTSYINKGKDAAAKGNLATMLTNGTIFFETNGNYNDWTRSMTVCNVASAPGFLSPCRALIDAGYSTLIALCDTGNDADNACPATATKWCAMIQLKSDTSKTYCVDSSGAKYLSSTAMCQGAPAVRGTCSP